MQVFLPPVLEESGPLANSTQARVWCVATTLNDRACKSQKIHVCVVQAIARLIWTEHAQCLQMNPLC